jgi:hypothetical protein
MKVVYNGNILYHELTVGKVYEIITSPHDEFFVSYIINDKGKKFYVYDENIFTPLNKVRKEKLNQILK